MATEACPVGLLTRLGFKAEMARKLAAAAIHPLRTQKARKTPPLTTTSSNPGPSSPGSPVMARDEGQDCKMKYREVEPRTK